MSKRLNIYEIRGLLDILQDKYCDPYVEVGTVNQVLEVLGYSGYFHFNEITGKVRYRVKND